MPNTTKSLPPPKKYVDFDAHEPEHMVAYAMLTQYGRQHPTLRFYCKMPYHNIIDMMHNKIGEAYVNQFSLVKDRVKTLLQREIGE